MRAPIHALRLVLIALAIQFSSPVFYSVITTGAPLDGEAKTSIHANHSSIIAPQLIKEKDETESETLHFGVELVTLIDFTDHSFVLTAWHALKIAPLSFRNQVDPHPPLFTLHRVFLI